MLCFDVDIFAEEEEIDPLVVLWIFGGNYHH
jgi:hypothetical protein